MKSNQTYTVFFYLSVVVLLSAIAAYAIGQVTLGNVLFSGFWLSLAIGVQRFRSFSQLTFTLFIFAAVTLALAFPEALTRAGSFEYKELIVPLLQVIMFGVGTAMSLRDFQGVLKMPKGVGVGLLCQFTIMPVVGFTIAHLFGFPNEIAAGIVLVGSSPSGLASNVMAHIAKANLALSITLTSVATVLAPIATPFLMSMLGGEFVQVDVLGMMWGVVKMVILPVGLGLVFNHFLHGKFAWLDRFMPKLSMIGIVLIIVIITAAGRDSLLNVGALLIVAMFIHMTCGFFLGYWGARLFGMPENDCRTVAIEVGMQNGGLASGIAASMGKINTLGLAAAVNGPVMNISGSALATWWSKKTPQAKHETTSKLETV
ncbi:bile acid:sodium symporter family protein [Marinoscillum furvescens]|uniref:BASS family bile acid:Na+ symporter n=1 Tax=Marinoscillum furvescens DSM 4134 TaxID=1122208 RepID=A0A3D9L3P4_MARFU|nr:bile acid:sodium symporter family protein [Marinoscillum furvescens]REE00081.1 BASS family bile acid:Na+ symporter [Marinoscillum furvescens DSM 4134]